MSWTKADLGWIKRMNQLFDDLFGPDFCEFDDTESKHRILVPGQLATRMYDHDEWEKNLEKVMEDEEDVDDGTSKKRVNAGSDKKVDVQKVIVEEDCQEEADDNSVKQTENAETVSLEQFSQEEKESTIKQTPKNAETVDVKEVQEEGNSKRNENAESDQARFTELNDLTRAELAALKFPKVAFITENEVTVIQPHTSPVKIGDPTLATHRPSEAIVQHATKLLQDSSVKSDCVDSEAEEEEFLVNLGRIGCFTKKGVQVFQTMCRLSSEARRVSEETKWLSQTPSVPGVSLIKELLFNRRPHDEVTRHRDFILDVSDFSTLACERYVNGFAIDVVSFKFLERTKHEGIIYLPSFSQLWAKQGVEYFKHKVGSFLSQRQVAGALIILTPVHFKRPPHWGLLCFDVYTRTVYFDDGLKISPTSDTLHIVKNMLCAFKALSHGAIPEEHWNKSLPLPRFDMPVQPGSGIGAGSCGVGVMLAVRDIIASGKCCPTFSWRFEDMTKLRQELMALIIQWKNEEVCAL